MRTFLELLGFTGRLKTVCFLLCLLFVGLSACSTGQVSSSPSSPVATAPADASEAGAQVFVPLLGANPTKADSAATPRSTNQPTPFIHLQEGASSKAIGSPIFPPLEISPTVGIDNGTRGIALSLGGKVVQLPEDTYAESVAQIDDSASSEPERPYVILRRGIYRVAVTAISGQIYVDSPTAATREEAIQEFDFLIQILGKEKIMPPDGSCADC